MTRIVVCGSNYGAFYVAALRHASTVGTLVALLAAGSQRSRRLATRNGVPLCRCIDDLPIGTELACVAIGAGGELVVDRLLAGGLHVLCEHPVGSGRVAEMTRLASENGVRFHVNAHFPDLPAGRHFVEQWRGLSAERGPRHVGMVCSDRALYAVAALVAEATIGSSSRWSWDWGRRGRPFSAIGGKLGDCGLLLEVQRTDGELDLADGSPEILVDFCIRVTFETGVLSLLSPAGPVLWCANGNRVKDGSDPLFDSVGELASVTARQFYDERIAANRRSIRALVGDVGSGMVPANQTSDHLLRVSRLWESASRAIADARR
jgi:thiazolinyl imide reductase